jgi:hypothetical protein
VLTPDLPDAALRRLDVVWRLLLRSVLLIQVALLLATFAVPMLGRDTDPDDADPARTTRVLPGLLAYVRAQPSEFGDRDRHPLAVPGGVWMTRIALVMLLVALVLVVLATYGLALERVSRSTPIIARIGGILLFAGVGMLAVAQVWLSDDHVATPLQPGLLLPLAAGVWILSVTSARTRMDELDRL